MALSGKRTQSRGRLRRVELLEAARCLLREREVQQITLPDIAASAGIPRASAYHFFSDVQDVFRAVAEVVGAELLIWQENIDLETCADWRQIVEAYIRRGANFFRENVDASQLLIGPYTPPIVKLSDRESDLKLARQLLGMISGRYCVPLIDNGDAKFYHAIEIADLLFCLSNIRFGHITPEYEDEAIIASISYLSVYIPSILSLPKDVNQEMP